jgi:hypothetical protein
MAKATETDGAKIATLLLAEKFALNDIFKEQQVDEFVEQYLP